MSKRNLSANARNPRGLILGISHMLRSNWACEPQLLSWCSTAWKSTGWLHQLLKPASPRLCAQQQERPLLLDVLTPLLEAAPLTATRKEGHTAMRTQHSQKINTIIQKGLDAFTEAKSGLEVEATWYHRHTALHNCHWEITLPSSRGVGQNEVRHLPSLSVCKTEEKLGLYLIIYVLKTKI